mmetsp:Transcript_15446/g.18899  ORF Transcript_15446/g.18899 Transcript_15446/m.18899 type:complete len:477 (+) Transcript_15446:56-1486(+)
MTEQKSDIKSNDDIKMDDNKQELLTQDTLSVRFVTRINNKDYHLSDTSYDLPSVFTPNLLNGTINELLKNERNIDKKLEFSFLIQNNYLNTSIKEHLNTYGISSESTIKIEYIEKTIEPTSKSDNKHPDWVSCIDRIPLLNKNELYLTGCYDGIVRIWDSNIKSNGNEDNDPGLYSQYRGHFSPIKGVSYLYSNKNIHYFVSCSKNSEVKIFELNDENRKVTPITSLNKLKYNLCHTMSIETVCAPFNSKVFGTGSMDKNIRIYRFNHNNNNEIISDNNNIDEPSKKKRKLDNEYTLECLSVLRGHKDKIKCMDWTLTMAMYSCSWDKTIKLWDVTKEIDKYTWTTNSSINVIKYWIQQNLLLTAHTNHKICLWDPRTDIKIDTKHVKSVNQFRSHSLPITDLSICLNGNNIIKNNDYLFISTSFDGKIKIWDIRNNIKPLYNIKKHYGKILSCKWYGNTILSGGTDCQLRSFVFK